MSDFVPLETDAEMDRLLAQEALIEDVTETICELLEREGVSRQELAQRLGKTKGYVSQVLSGERNMTLRTAADLAHVLGYRLAIDPRKEEAQRAPATPASRQAGSSGSAELRGGRPVPAAANEGWYTDFMTQSFREPAAGGRRDSVPRVVTSRQVTEQRIDADERWRERARHAVGTGR